MATYKITAPDGSSYNVTAPDDASQADVLAYAQQQHTAPASTTPVGSDPNLKGSSLGAVYMGIRDAIDGGAQLLRRAVPDSVGNAVDAFGNTLASWGLPVTPSTGVAGVDQIVRNANAEYDTARAADGRTGLDVARIVGNVINPVNRIVPIAGSTGAIAAKSAAQGALSGLTAPVTDTDHFAGAKVGQTVLGAGGGAVAGAAMSKLLDGVGSVVGWIQGALPGSAAKSASAADDAINQAATSAGVDLSQFPGSMLDAVRAQAAKALASGQKFDSAAALRQTEGNIVLPKAPLTLGQATRNPQQYATEVNLRGVDGAGQPLADRFAAQNNGLIDALNAQGASQAPGGFQTGNVLMDALRKADAQTQSGISDLYATARGMNGGDIPLDARGFSDAAMDGLDSSMKSAFLPKEIRGIVNDISTGKTPLTVSVGEQLKTILANASGAARDGNARQAIGIVRDALEGAQPLTNDAGVLDAFGAARSAAKARFASLDTNPAMRSAIGSGEPDDFFAKQVINGDVSGVNALVQALKASSQPEGQVANPLVAALSPEPGQAAIQAARSQIVSYLKSKALNGASDEVGSFSQSGYNRALSALGDAKLATLFDPTEIETLKRIGRVASYTGAAPKGSAVNSSNTAATVLNLLSGLSGNFGTLPGVNIAARSFRDFQQSQTAKNALLAKLQPEAVKDQPDALRALLAPSAGAFGSASAQMRR